MAQKQKGVADAMIEAELRPVGPRPLPLKRFIYSRKAQQTPDGFYYQPAGLSEDFPIWDQDITKIERVLKVVHQVDAKIFRFCFPWNAIEHQKDKYNWAIWDQIVERSLAYNLILFACVCYTPQWASDQKDYWAAPPRLLGDFADFMKTLAMRYKGKIKAWALWNEPDLPCFFSGSPEQFARMVITQK